MADNTEKIGSISVDIVGDYSTLQPDIDTAAQIAQRGAEEIASAFNTGASSADSLASAFGGSTEAASAFEAQIQALIDSGSTLAEALAAVATGAAEVGAKSEEAAQQLSLFDEEAMVPYADAAGQLNLFSDALEPIAPAAETAAAGLQEFRQSESDAGHTAQEVGASLEELGHQFLALGEAFVITEGLKEFGLEALAAADDITRASISLKALTGSAEEAETVIKGLEQLGVQDGLAMPSLLTATTRMQAILGEGTDVVSLLGQLANSATVMGTSVEAAANSFDRIASAGTLGARQLVQLGLSLDQVAAAMNKVSGDSDATASNVAKLFKAMDQTERIQVLSTALQGLGGIAQETAQKTFGGQWQSLSTQFEQIMRDVGDALLPVITDLTEFIKIDILPWVKSVTEGFNALSPPIKDAVVAVGLLAAAAPPLLLALGGVGLAISGLNEVIPILGGLMEALGLKTAAAAAAETAEAAVATASAAAHGAAAVEMGTMSGVAATLQAATSGVMAAGQALLASPFMAVATYAALAVSVYSLVQAYRELSAAQTNLAKDVQTAEDSLSAAEITVKRLVAGNADLTASFLKLKEQYSSGQIGLAEYVRGLQEMVTTYRQANPVIDDHGAKLAALLNPTESLGIKMKSLQEAVTSTAAKLAETTRKYDDNKASAQDVAAAYDAWQSATKALAGEQAKHVTVVTELAKATRDFVLPVKEYPDAAKAAADAQEAFNIKIQAQSEALATSQRVLDAMVQKFQEGRASAADVAKALDDVNAKQKALDATIGASPVIDFSAGVVSAHDVNKALDDMFGKLQPLPPPIKSVNDLLADMGIKVTEAGDLVTNKIIKAYDDLSTRTHTLEEENLAWGKISSTLGKLSKADLPEVLSLYDKHLQQLVSQGAAEGLILDTQAKELQSIIALKTQSGDAATSEIVNLAQVRLAQQALTDASQLWGNTIVGVQNDVIKGWQNLGSAIADNIVMGGKWRDTFIKVGEDVAKMILNTLIGSAFKALEDEIIKATGLSLTSFGSITKSVDSLGSSVKSVGGSVASATGQLQSAASTMATTASTVLATAGLIAGIVGAIAGIISAIEGARTNELLYRIEVDARGILNEMQNLRSDLWAQDTGILQKFDMLNETVSVKMDNWYNDGLSMLGNIWQSIQDGFAAVVGALGGGGTVPGSNLPATSLPTRSVTSLPSVGGSNTVPASVAGSVYGSSSVSQASNINASFTINEAGSPRETARQVITVMKGLSPSFSPGS